MISLITGDATKPTALPAIIAHVCNDEGRWGAGFSGAVGRCWPAAERAYRLLGREHNRRIPLGTVQPVKVSETITIANMVAQRGVGTDRRRLDYTALNECLRRLRWMAVLGQKSTIHMPRIGSGLGGGDWNVIFKNIQTFLSGVDVYIYSLQRMRGRCFTSR